MEIYLATTVNGLCNRIKNLISVLRLSPHSKSTFLQFNNIFDNDFTTLDPNIKYKDLCTWRIIVNDDDVEIPINFNTNTLDLPERDKMCRDIDSEYERIPMEFRNKIIKIIDQFIIKKEIQSVLDQYNFKNTNACHIRTWWSTYHKEYDDWSKFLKSKSNLDYLSNFEKIISNTNEKIFVACDDYNFKNYLKMKYKNIITYERNEIFNDVQNDFIEVQLLSKCNILYGTKLSTFSEMSWWFSRCNQKVLFT